VNLTPLGLLAHAKSEAGRRALRYTATSLFGVAMSQIMLTYFLHVLDWIPWRANLVAVSLTAVPAFILNKRWVWGKRGKAHLRREVIPFWSFTVAGWALSTAAVQLVVSMTRTASNPNGNKLAVQAANIAGFGVLWVLKYVFLDKIMFGTDHHTPYDEDIEIEEAMAESGQATPAADPAAAAPATVDRAAVDPAAVDR
jgi:putative flippase GtrA